MSRRIAFRLLICLLAMATGLPAAQSQSTDAPTARRERRKENQEQRKKSLRAIADHLGIGPGSVVADIGAGKGPDTWVFADIVGEDGRVLSEEISDKKVDSLKQGVDKRNLSQVEVILGTSSDPSLPANSIDMAFMHFVYHHVTKPREMLLGIWRSLKPGGHLVIVDQRRGTLEDWVPREERGENHHWIAETTVVREAREQGFRFVECAESYWHVKKSFVLVFQRPLDLTEPGRDPDAPSPIPETAVKQLVPTGGEAYQRIAFVALDEGRSLMAPILKAINGEAVDIVLEEWATQKDERPPLPTGWTVPSVLTEKGDPGLGPEPLDAVYFLDSYHRLFHGPVLLAKIREHLTSQGRIFIVDRKSPRELPHREASHRRMISAETVQQEMAEAGFRLLREGTPPTTDRFLLVFEKAESTANSTSGSAP